MDVVKEFIDTYIKVFNKDGAINNCGREHCKYLIYLAEQLGDTGTDYGDKNTGFMNTKNIKDLYNRLN